MWIVNFLLLYLPVRIANRAYYDYAGLIDKCSVKELFFVCFATQNQSIKCLD